MTKFKSTCLSLVTICVFVTNPSQLPASQPDLLAGHSIHGEAYNEGPRQAAYLMPGMGNIDFPATTDNELAQRFINQGVAQLHGFWYYEAERSFRQAAVHDPECAIAYWGMALANVENRKRAWSFIEEAVTRKDSATRREQLFIDAYAKYSKDEDDKGKKIEKKTRAQDYTKDLGEIVEEFPDDIEAKAFLALQLWQNERAELPIVSHVAIEAVLDDIFDVNPMHPAHHFRIHLNDGYKPKLAVASSALCGQSLPGVAHMWHMPGHIYSKLNRYQDAVWQQEASARVDHAHMMRDRVLPDQIHNFAHNNEWLIRNLLKLGRVDDALDLAKNMASLPRHPKYNTLTKGSTKYGRERLLLTLSTYQLWPKLIEFANSVYLEPTDDAELQEERWRYLGIALALSGQSDEAASTRAELEQRLADAEASIAEIDAEMSQEKSDAKKSDTDKPDSEQETTPKDDTAQAGEKVAKKCVSPEETQEVDKAAAQDETTPDAAELQKDDVDAEIDSDSAAKETSVKAEAPKKADANRKHREKERADKLKKLKESKKRLTKQIAAIKSAESAIVKDWDAAFKHWDDSDMDDKLLRAQWQAASGKFDEAIEALDKEIGNKPNEVLPVACKAWLQYSNSGSESSKETFEQLRTVASVADLGTPLLARLSPLAAELNFDEHWAADYKIADDVGQRPDLDSLGSFRWHPYMAPNFSANNSADEMISLKQLRGKPTLVIFYLGFGCLHCVEQLHKFSPRAEEFRQTGIDIVAISSENTASLSKALSDYSQPLDIPLYSDSELTTFKSFRCYDDFEQQPLHGTFLIDPEGKVLWQDISFEPFMDVNFALQESSRLLKLAGFESHLAPN